MLWGSSLWCGHVPWVTAEQLLSAKVLALTGSIPWWAQGCIPRDVPAALAILPAQGTAATRTHLGAALGFLGFILDGKEPFWSRSGCPVQRWQPWKGPGRWAAFTHVPALLDELCLLELFTALVDKHSGQRAVFHEHHTLHVPAVIFQEHK